MPYGIEDWLGHIVSLRQKWRMRKRDMKLESLSLPYVALSGHRVQRVVEISL